MCLYQAIMTELSSRTLYRMALDIQIIETQVVALAEALQTTELQKRLTKHARTAEKLEVLLEALHVLRDRYLSELLKVH